MKSLDQKLWCRRKQQIVLHRLLQYLVTHSLGFCIQEAFFGKPLLDKSKEDDNVSIPDQNLDTKEFLSPGKLTDKKPLDTKDPFEFPESPPAPPSGALIHLSSGEVENIRQLAAVKLEAPEAATGTSAAKATVSVSGSVDSGAVTSTASSSNTTTATTSATSQAQQGDDSDKEHNMGKQAQSYSLF